MATLVDSLYMFIQALMVIAVWSYMYKDNLLTRFSAQIVVSTSTVFFFLSNYQNVINQRVIPMFQGEYLNIIPIILGLLLFTRLFKGYGWMSSYSYAVALGLGTGATLTTLIPGSVITRITDTIMMPFNAKTMTDQLGGWVTIIGVIFSLSYWLFTVEFTGNKAYVLKIGRVFLMCSIGMLYAEDVLWSQSLFVGAAQMVLKFIYVVVLNIPFG